MSRFNFGACIGLAVALALPAYLAAAPAAPGPDKKDGESEKADAGKFQPFKPESVSSNGTVTIGGQSISYQAIAGTLVVHPKDWDDVPRDPKAEKGPAPGDDGPDKNPTAEASMFYVAYFKAGGGSSRAGTFVYNHSP